MIKEVKTPNSQSKLSFIVEHIDKHPHLKNKYIKYIRNNYSVSKEFDLDYLEKYAKDDIYISYIYRILSILENKKIEITRSKKLLLII